MRLPITRTMYSGVGLLIPKIRSVVDALKERDYTIAVAESATGGRVSSMITSIPGASSVLKGSVVVYTGFAKDLLGCGECWRDYGTVSPEIAVCIASRVAAMFGTDIGVGIVGTMGPGYDEKRRHIGQVFYALWFKGQIVRSGGFLSDLFGRRRRIEMVAYKVIRLLGEVMQT